MRKEDLASQDSRGTSFCETLQACLDDGWRVVPGTLGFQSLDVPIESVGYSNPRDTKKVVCGYCVIEKEDDHKD